MDIPKLLYANGKDSNALYVTGVYIPDPYYFLDFGHKKYVFLDDREVGVFLDHNTNPHIEVVNVAGFLDAAKELPGAEPLMYKLGVVLLREYGVTGAQVANNFPLALADYMRSQNIELTTTGTLYPERLRKQPAELDLLRNILGITSKAFTLIEQVLEESTIADELIMYQGKPLTSEALKAKVEQLFLENGASNDEGLVISCGAHAAIPHHAGRGELKAHQTIVCDIFPRHKKSGYFADMTRTYVKGVPSAYVQQMYTAVAEAQQAAIAAVRPGIPGQAVHRVVEESIKNAGFMTGAGEGFTHGTGHGLGLDVHEAPYFNSSHEELLEPGHVLSVEPGLYYKEHGGVRIEDIIVVTKNGAELLSQHPYRWVIP